MPRVIEADMRTLRLLLLILLIAVISSCSRGSDGDGSHAIRALPRSIPLARVEAALGTEHRLQFHEHLEGADYLCISYSFSKPYVKLYFLFQDGILVKVSEPPPFAYQVVPFES